MAIQAPGLSIPYTDDAGVAHGTTFWVVAFLSVVPVDRVASWTWYGYKDRDAYDARRRPLGSRAYSVAGDEFDAMVEAHLTPGGPNVLAMIFDHTLNAADVVVDPADPSRNVAFFQGATVVGAVPQMTIRGNDDDRRTRDDDGGTDGGKQPPAGGRPTPPRTGPRRSRGGLA